jgi:hypothetical protein
MFESTILVNAPDAPSSRQGPSDVAVKEQSGSQRDFVSGVWIAIGLSAGVKNVS